MSSTHLLLSLILILYLILSGSREANCTINMDRVEAQEKLIKHLFNPNKYNPLIRPAKNYTDRLFVRFGMAIIQLIHVDERKQVLKMNVWLRMNWTDYRLKWNPDEYAGITVIRVGPDKAWNPDIVLYNNAHGDYEVAYRSRMLVFNDGSVKYIPPSIIKSSCLIDVKYFPWDEQSCEIKFGSWTYNADQIEMKWYEDKPYADLTDYTYSGMWDLMNCSGMLFRVDVVHDHPSRSLAIFTVVIRRKTLFYVFTLIVPCLLISILSVCAFYLPTSHSEKLTLNTSILFALLVFLLLLEKRMPPSSINIPLFANYLLFSLLVNFSSVIFTVSIVHWSNRPARIHQMSAWVKIVFLCWLPWILNMHNCPITSSMFQKRRRQRHFTKQPWWRRGCNGDHLRMNLIRATIQEHRPVYCYQWRFFRRQGNDTQTAVRSLNDIIEYVKFEQSLNLVKEEWRYLGRVLDRLCLSIFIIVSIAGGVSILLVHPHSFQYTNQAMAIETIKQAANAATIRQ